MTTLNENQNLNSFVQQHRISSHNYETMILVSVGVNISYRRGSRLDPR